MFECIDNFFHFVGCWKKYKEDEYTELKSILYEDIKNEIVAFANSGDGRIYIGIDDDENIVYWIEFAFLHKI